MDIFEQSLAALNVDIHFNHEGCFTCTLKGEDGGSGLNLFVYKHVQQVSLSLIMMGQTDIPEKGSHALLMQLGERAMSPLNEGLGVGILPNTQRISVYKKVTLLDKPLGYVMDNINQLIAELELWDRYLLGDETVFQSSQPNSHARPRLQVLV
ncbi:hypothetical protein [Shewanella surugensis]|uniref:Uncharacterized protein n=1 Tax=Shewanella surugensis TaxID=212020 RepID=A0ABT0L6P4_9GAMM|nr:hypothetical protein [Shewanella surugensis]MCL1123364.1 hypothetical protein [Shewanella surugensis]